MLEDFPLSCWKCCKGQKVDFYCVSMLLMCYDGGFLSYTASLASHTGLSGGKDGKQA